MSRPLRIGLIAEDDSDSLFLEPLIYRQVTALLDSQGKAPVDLFQRVERCPVPIIGATDRVRAAARDTAASCHLFFAHSDWSERAKAEALVEHVRGSAAGSHARALVVLVPRKETEAWMIADPTAFRRFRGSDPSCLPVGPQQAEKTADPKKTLAAVMAGVRHNAPEDYFGALGERVDLANLAHMSAYESWVNDTRDALKELHFL